MSLKMSRLILYDIPHYIKKDFLKCIFDKNENNVEILLFFINNETNTNFAIINFKTKDECMAAMKNFYNSKMDHLPSTVKLQQLYEIDDDNESSNKVVNNNTIHVQYKNIIQKYEQNSSLDDVIYFLNKDQKSIICTGHDEFVKSMSLVALNECRLGCITKVGNMFVELLFKNIISITSIIHGICDALEEWKGNAEDYPESYSQISALITPILISETAISLKIFCLKNTFITLRPDFSITVFIEILLSLLKSTKVQDLKLDACDTKDIIFLNNNEHIIKSNDIQQNTKDNGITRDKGIPKRNSVSLCFYNDMLQESNDGLKKYKLEHEKIKNNEIHNKSITKINTICLLGPNVILHKTEDNGLNKHNLIIDSSLKNSICLSNLRVVHAEIEKIHSITMNSSVGYDEYNLIANMQYENNQNQYRLHISIYNMLEYLMITTKTKDIDMKNALSVYSRTSISSNREALSQNVQECNETVSQTSNATNFSQIVQNPIQFSSLEDKGQSSKPKKKNDITSPNGVLQQKNKEIKQLKTKTINKVQMYPCDFKIKEKQLVHECGQKGEKPFLVPCKNDETNESLNSFDNHMQTSRPLLSNNSLTVVPLICISPNSKLPNCSRRKNDSLKDFEMLSLKINNGSSTPIKKSKFTDNEFIDPSASKINKISSTTLNSNTFDENEHKNSALANIAEKPVKSTLMSEEDICKQCIKAVKKYKKTNNFLRFAQTQLQRMYEFDVTSDFHPQHEICVMTIVIVSLTLNFDNRKDAACIITQFVSGKILTILSVTKGINRILKNMNKFCLEESNIYLLMSDVFAALLVSNCFEFHNVIDCFFDIKSYERFCFFTFVKILNNIYNWEENEKFNEFNGVIPWIYNKWSNSRHTKSLADLVTYTSFNLLIHDIGPHESYLDILTMTMCDIMRYSKNELTYVILTSWVENHKIKFLCSPFFVLSVTMAVILAITGGNGFDGTFDNFFKNFHKRIIDHYIMSERVDRTFSRQEGEVQCIYGIQTVAAALQYPKNMILKLFNELYKTKIISPNSFISWKNEKRTLFLSDYEANKSKAISLSTSFFELLENQKKK